MRKLRWMDKSIGLDLSLLDWIGLDGLVVVGLDWIGLVVVGLARWFHLLDQPPAVWECSSLLGHPNFLPPTGPPAAKTVRSRYALKATRCRTRPIFHADVAALFNFFLGENPCASPFAFDHFCLRCPPYGRWYLRRRLTILIWCVQLSWINGPPHLAHPTLDVFVYLCFVHVKKQFWNTRSRGESIVTGQGTNGLVMTRRYYHSFVERGRECNESNDGWRLDLWFFDFLNHLIFSRCC